MLRFSANLSFLYPDLPFLDRFRAAAQDGFEAVEYVSPYDQPAEAVAEILNETGLRQALFNLPAGQWDAGERGIGCLPDRREEFQEGLKTAIQYAKVLECPKLNCLAGIAPTHASHAELEAVFVDNLSLAAAMLADEGILLVIEPINLKDIPGFFLSHTDHAERLLERVESPNLKIQFDLYHAQIMQGDLIATFKRLHDQIGHIQLADNPGRHEPGTGEINYFNVLRAIEDSGYQGFIGCEDTPLAGTSEGLHWMQPFR